MNAAEMAVLSVFSQKNGLNPLGVKLKLFRKICPNCHDAHDLSY